MCVNKFGGRWNNGSDSVGRRTEWALIRLHTPIHNYILTKEWPKFLTNWKYISRSLNANLISNSELSSLWIKLFAWWLRGTTEITSMLSIPNATLRFDLYPYTLNTQNLFIYLFRWDFLFQIYHEFGFQIASIHPLSHSLTHPLYLRFHFCSIWLSVSLALSRFLFVSLSYHLPIKCNAPPKIKIKS